MNKHELIMRDIILKYNILEGLDIHVDENTAMKRAQAFNVEHLVELAMEKIGDYTFLDESGYDFSDFSDCKTASIGVPKGKTSGQMAISALGTKIGAIRAVIYNPFYRRLDYMFFPFKEWKKYEEPKYKSGFISLYRELNCEILPIAVNSGKFWPKHTFVKKEGHIIIKILPIIKSGMGRKEILIKVENSIEEETSKII